MSTGRKDQKVAHDLDSVGSKQKTADIMIDENLDFNGMLLSEPVLKGLKKAGFKRPSPIQLRAIPSARCGIDLIVQAKSGTGKTCVFVVAALETVVPANSGTQVLVLSPTREIARQSYETFVAIGCCIPGLKYGCFIGGPTLKNDKATSKQCHVVVGTPGRVCQLIQEGDLSVDGVRLFVLDEADKLMDDSYQENVNWIFSRLPANKQLIVLSATYPRQLDEFLSKYMKTPQMIKLDSDDVQLIGIKQYVYTIASIPGEDWWEKKIEGLHNLLSKASFSQCLIFCNYQDKVERLHSKLKDLEWPVEYIAAQLTQPQRLSVMRRLKKFQCRILVSTDLTARGIDAEHVNLVINFDVPFNAETYFHRIGRAGRFGGYGAAITVLCGWQTEFCYYQMAIENNFRSKQLPDVFPMDVVANESFFESLPPLKLPDMANLERKVAYKNARKNMNLPSEDFYGKLMKMHGYKFRRNDPDSFKFVADAPLNVTNGEVYDSKYDRHVFESVLNQILGVKEESKKPEKKPKSKNANAKKKVLADANKHDDLENGVEINVVPKNLTQVPIGLPLSTVNDAVAGVGVDDSVNCLSDKLSMPMVNGDDVVEDINGDGAGIVESSEIVSVDRDNFGIPSVTDRRKGLFDHSSPLRKVLEDAFSSSVHADDRQDDCVSVDSDVKGNVSTFLIENGFSIKIPVASDRSSNAEGVAKDDERQIVESVFHSHDGDDEILEEVSENNIATSVCDSFDGSIISGSVSVDFPKSKARHFEVFEKTLDSHLCYLYGGFSWHMERAKFLSDKAPVVGNAVVELNPVQKGIDVQDLVSVAAGVDARCTHEVASEAALSSDATAAGRYVIAYSREALLSVWNQVARTASDVRQSYWYKSLVDLDLFVARDFNQQSNENVCFEEYANFTDVEVNGNPVCPCWSEYEKVLKQYQGYVRNYSLKYGDDVVEEYGNSVENFRSRTFHNRQRASGLVENPLANSHRDMSAYYKDMLFE